MLLKELPDLSTDRLADDLRDELGDITQDIKEKVAEVIRRRVEAVIDQKADAFWRVWYPANRKKKLVNLPSPLPDIEVNDLRSLFEQIFGPRPE